MDLRYMQDLCQDVYNAKLDLQFQLSQLAEAQEHGKETSVYKGRIVVLTRVYLELRAELIKKAKEITLE